MLTWRLAMGGGRVDLCQPLFNARSVVTKTLRPEALLGRPAMLVDDGAGEAMAVGCGDAGVGEEQTYLGGQVLRIGYKELVGDEI